MRLVGWVLVMAVVLTSGACAKTGSVRESTPVASLAAYKTARVEVELPTSVKNADAQKAAFAEAVAQGLRERKIFSDVVKEGGDVFVKVTVVKVDAGSAFERGMGTGGDAEVTARVELLDASDNKNVGAFDVTGNSKKSVTMAVGGVDTAAVEDSTGRALRAAADEIAGYLQDRRDGTR